MKAKLIKTDKDNYTLFDEKGIPIGTTPNVLSNNTFSKLSKQNCDEIFGIVDVEKLVFCEFPNGNINGETSIEQKIKQFAFKVGFNKAMELNKDKVFTIDDMRKAFNQNPAQTNRPFNEFIQSLQQPTEIEVKIEMEDTFEKTSEVYTDEVGSGNYFSHSKKPKLDSEGCLILKKI